MDRPAAPPAPRKPRRCADTAGADRLWPCNKALDPPLTTLPWCVCPDGPPDAPVTADTTDVPEGEGGRSDDRRDWGAPISTPPSPSLSGSLYVPSWARRLARVVAASPCGVVAALAARPVDAPWVTRGAVPRVGGSGGRSPPPHQPLNHPSAAGAGAGDGDGAAAATADDRWLCLRDPLPLALLVLRRVAAAARPSVAPVDPESHENRPSSLASSSFSAMEGGCAREGEGTPVARRPGPTAGDGSGVVPSVPSCRSTTLSRCDAEAEDANECEYPRRDEVGGVMPSSVDEKPLGLRPSGGDPMTAEPAGDAAAPPAGAPYRSRDCACFVGPADAPPAAAPPPTADNPVLALSRASDGSVTLPPDDTRL